MNKREFIEFMTESGVLTFGDFTTKSGRQTPYFINTGNYKTGSQIARLGRFYAQCIMENIDKGNIHRDTKVLFGPAYKGIPLAAATAIALSNEYDKEFNFSFNRKEEKDHGEGGSMVGYKLQNGDRVLIIEDVITAGTAVRECLPKLHAAADIHIEGLVVSVDRMERGMGSLSAVRELAQEQGIETYPIINIKEIVEALEKDLQEGSGTVDADTLKRMEEYIYKYCLR